MCAHALPRDSGSSANDLHVSVVVQRVDFGPKAIWISSLTQHEDGASWFARAAGAPREARQETRCASPVPESLNGEQHLGNTDGCIGVSIYATVRPRQRGFAGDCEPRQQLEADFQKGMNLVFVVTIQQISRIPSLRRCALDFRTTQTKLDTAHANMHQNNYQGTFSFSDHTEAELSILQYELSP